MDSDEEFALDENFDEESYAYEDDTEVVYCKPGTPEAKEYESSGYQVIPADKVAEEMDECITEVMSVINIPKTVTRLLLNHFKWDREKLMERYYDGDQEKLFEDARVANPFKPGEKPASSDECQVCFLESSEKTGLQCGHLFCPECWNEYLSTKITSEGIADRIPCAACELLVDDDTVKLLLREPSDRSRYQRLIMNAFVDANRLFRWCPAPGCSYVVKVAAAQPRLIRCECGHAFCFGCGESWHEPVDCGQLAKWVKKCTDDSETLNWLSANTKSCPNCTALIEKNGGCNRILCAKKTCRFEFCWICMEAWRVHGYANPCNTFEPRREIKEKSRLALEKYLFYCNRYISHQQSLKLEGQMKEAIEKKIREYVHEQSFSWMEVQCLRDALDTLRSCRQTLSYTYVFAYSVRKNNQVLIFEDNQNDLHRAVESLSGYLEKDLEDTEEDFANIKIKILDECRYCEDRRKTLIAHVREGYEKNWWDFIE